MDQTQCGGAMNCHKDQPCLTHYIWIELNEKYSNLWPNITKKRSGDVPQDEAKWREVKDKLKYFSEKPGKGD